MKQIAASILASREPIDRSVGLGTAAGDLFCNVSFSDKSGEGAAKSHQQSLSRQDQRECVCDSCGAMVPEVNINLLVDDAVCDSCCIKLCRRFKV